MGRPKTAVKTTAVQVRLDPQRLAVLDVLVEQQRLELRGSGLEVSRASFLRGLLDREIDATAPKGKKR